MLVCVCVCVVRCLSVNVCEWSVCAVCGVWCVCRVCELGKRRHVLKKLFRELRLAFVRTLGENQIARSSNQVRAIFPALYVY